jgi:hypothetical protein
MLKKKFLTVKKIVKKYNNKLVFDDAYVLSASKRVIKAIRIHTTPLH